MTERVLQSAGFLSRLRGRRAVPRGAYDPSFFLRRTAAVVGMALVFVALGALSGTYVGFDFMQAILDVPGGLVWMATQFPFLTSLQKLDTILPPWVRRFSPRSPPVARRRFWRISARCWARDRWGWWAVSSSCGPSRPVPLPVVAWAFILLFSFKRAVTGFSRCSSPASVT
ncbi:MAG: hypothetical protein ACLT98_17780 [Eggerthellaceae bacterium]